MAMLKYRYLIGFTVDRAEIHTVIQELGMAIKTLEDVEMVRDFISKAWHGRRIDVLSFSHMETINTAPKRAGGSRKLIHESRPEYRRINT